MGASAMAREELYERDTLFSKLRNDRERNIFKHVADNSNISVAKQTIEEYRSGKEIFYGPETVANKNDVRVLYRYTSLNHNMSTNMKSCWFSADQHTIRLMELAGVKHELLGVER